MSKEEKDNVQHPVGVLVFHSILFVLLLVFLRDKTVGVFDKPWVWPPYFLELLPAHSDLKTSATYKVFFSFWKWAWPPLSHARPVSFQQQMTLWVLPLRQGKYYDGCNNYPIFQRIMLWSQKLLTLSINIPTKRWLRLFQTLEYRPFTLPGRFGWQQRRLSEKANNSNHRSNKW